MITAFLIIGKNCLKTTIMTLLVIEQNYSIIWFLVLEHFFFIKIQVLVLEIIFKKSANVRLLALKQWVQVYEVVDFFEK